MEVKKERLSILAAGLVIGLVSAALAALGNPANMGFCIACFLRDISGGLGLHQAAAVQYIRPEIPGLVLGSFAVALVKKEFSPRGGSAPITRFVLGLFVMIGCLMFLGLGCKVTRWNDYAVDVISHLGGKASGIKEYLLLNHIGRDESMAFGDGENDIEMLKFVQISVAMGNADDLVKRSSDFVTDSVDHDGVEKALIQLGVIG